MAIIPVSTSTFLNCASTFTWWKQCQIKAKCFQVFFFVMFHKLFILFYYQSHFSMSTERCTIHNWSGYSTNMKWAIQINYLGPSCNRRHVRHSWPGVRRWVGVGGLGGWVFECFFLVHKTGLWKTCLGGRAITDTILFMCLLKGLTFITFPLIYMAEVYFLCLFKMWDLSDAIKENWSLCVLVLYGATCWHVSPLLPFS